MAKAKPAATYKPRARAMTAVLLAELEKAADDGSGRTNNQIIAANIVRAATTGMVTFPDKRVLKLSGQDILNLWMKLYLQIDGPPKTEIDMTSGGEKINTKGYVGFTPDEWDASPKAD